MKVEDKSLGWAIKWKRKNLLDGEREWLEGNGEGGVKLFSTRQETQMFIKSKYSYIAARKDLRVEPHCWRVPRAVRVRIAVSEK